MPSHESSPSVLGEKLCQMIFSGARIEHVRAHRIDAAFDVPMHVHADLLQIDFIHGCTGRVVTSHSERQTPAPRGILHATRGILHATREVSHGAREVPHAITPHAVAMIGPGTAHAMSLVPVDASASVVHVRIELSAGVTRESLKSIRDELSRLIVVQSGLSAMSQLQAALTDVWRLWVADRGDSLLARARLAHAIALWPAEVVAVGSTVASRDLAVCASSRTSSRSCRASKSPDDGRLDSALTLMERRLSQPPSLDELARASNMSVRHFSRRFREAFGVSALDYFDRKRLSLAQHVLAFESQSVSEAASRLGFSSAAAFSRWFTLASGQTPGSYRDRPHVL